MREKVVLDYNTDVEFKGRCWDQIRLGVISLDKNYIFWFVDKFLSLHMSSDYTIRSYKWTTLECVKIYEEVLMSRRLENTMFKELINTIKDCICHGEYIISILDKSTILLDDVDDTPDTIHDSIIIGYDDYQEGFYVVDPSLGSEIKLIRYDTYEKSFNKAVCKMKNYNLWPYLTGLTPLSAIKPKKIEKVKPDVGFLYNLYYYENYLSCDLDNRQFDHYVTNNEWYGNSIYRGLYINLLTDLKKNKIEMTMKILYSLQYFYETRVSLSKRLDFMAAQYKWTDIEDIYIMIQTLVERWKLIKALFEKYYYSKDKSILKRLEEYLENAETIDNRVMKSISSLLERTVIETLY